jgi:cytochrome c peroxidase
MTDHIFHNNGLDAIPLDSGLAKVTKNGYDMGRFKTPSLRNIEYTAPYMHDGRFPNLDSVINFYSQGLQYSDYIDPLMKNVGIGGVRLDSADRQALKAFLLTFSDPDFISNPDFSDPNVSARRQPMP